MSSWKWTPTPPTRWARVNEDAIPRYVEIENAFGTRVQQIVVEFQDGSIDRQNALRRFGQEMGKAQIDAFVAGRRIRRVDHGSVSEQEAAMLHGRLRNQTQYFSKFLTDVEGGHGRMAYADRAMMYAKSLWGVFGRGETVDWENPSDSSRYDWILDVDAEHCKDCIERARRSREQGGFTLDELTEMGWPGDEHTQCGSHCRCHVRVHGVNRTKRQEVQDLKPARSSDEGWDELERACGGEGLPDPLPASGVPHVELQPALLQASAEASPEPDRLGQLAPTVPKLLAYPADVSDPAPGVKVFTGYGLKAQVYRRPDDGRWVLVALMLLDQERKRRKQEEDKRG